MEKWRIFIKDFKELSGRINYTYAHIYIIFYYLYEKGLVGRYYLKEKLGLGEATIRNILVKMRELGVIESLRGGHKLTNKGIEVAEEILDNVKIIDLDTPIKSGKYNVTILIRKMGGKIRTGIDERDNVIKYGGSGATVLIFRNGKIIFPDSGLEVDLWYPGLSNKIIKILKPCENDVILISGGASKESALTSGLNTAIELLNK